VWGLPQALVCLPAPAMLLWLLSPSSLSAFPIPVLRSGPLAHAAFPFVFFLMALDPAMHVDAHSFGTGQCMVVAAAEGGAVGARGGGGGAAGGRGARPRAVRCTRPASSAAALEQGRWSAWPRGSRPGIEEESDCTQVCPGATRRSCTIPRAWSALVTLLGWSFAATQPSSSLAALESSVVPWLRCTGDASGLLLRRAWLSTMQGLGRKVYLESTRGLVLLRSAVLCPLVELKQFLRDRSQACGHHGVSG